MLLGDEHKITNTPLRTVIRAKDASPGAVLTDTILDFSPVSTDRSSRIRDRVLFNSPLDPFNQSRDHGSESFEMRRRAPCPYKSRLAHGGDGVPHTSRRRPRPLWDEFDYVAHRDNPSFADNNGEWGHECPTQKWGERCNP